MTAVDELKRQAALVACAQVRNGMVVGLGTGSTAVHAVREIGRLLRAGSLADVVGVPTSTATARCAQEAGIPLVTLDQHAVVDLTIDGADEVDPRLNLIKGLGGALLREKIVAEASRRLVIVVDEGKRVSRLGEHVPVPVEVARFGWMSQVRFLESLGGRPTLRRDSEGEPFVTDEGHYVIDCRFAAISDPEELGRRLRSRAGIVEHGLFVGLASEVVVAAASGIETLRR